MVSSSLVGGGPGGHARHDHSRGRGGTHVMTTLGGGGGTHVMTTLKAVSIIDCQWSYVQPIID